jgi:hypothetical protein
MKALAALALAGILLGGLSAGSWFLGSAACEAALLDLEQATVHAVIRELSLSPTLKLEGYIVERRFPLPGLVYYEGQGQYRKDRISCADRRSVVFWYGTGAVVLWQDKYLLPARESVIEERTRLH